MPDRTLFTPERWLPVPGWEGFYEVSDHGRVRSLARIVPRAGGSHLPVRAKVRKPQVDGNGYLQVTLCREGEKHWQKIHVLVLLAFVGPRPDGLFACHNDGVPKNCHLSNLRWDTPSSNMHDRVAHGRNICANRTHCPFGHELAGANLVPSAPAHRGAAHRTCLACSRAKTAIRNVLRCGGVPLDHQTVSDMYHQRILGGLADERVPYGFAWRSGLRRPPRQAKLGRV